MRRITLSSRILRNSSQSKPLYGARLARFVSPHLLDLTVDIQNGMRFCIDESSCLEQFNAQHECFLTFFEYAYSINNGQIVREGNLDAVDLLGTLHI